MKKQKDVVEALVARDTLLLGKPALRLFVKHFRDEMLFILLTRGSFLIPKVGRLTLEKKQWRPLIRMLAPRAGVLAKKGESPHQQLFEALKFLPIDGSRLNRAIDTKLRLISRWIASNEVVMLEDLVVIGRHGENVVFRLTDSLKRTFRSVFFGHPAKTPRDIKMIRRINESNPIVIKLMREKRRFSLLDALP